MLSTDQELLERLADMPLLDRMELAAVSGRSTSFVYERIKVLESEGLVSSVPHGSELIVPTKRYFLTTSGLDSLAESTGTTTATLLRNRPATEEWLRALLRRLDSVGVIYRLTVTLCEKAFPIRYRWYRSVPADAAIALPDGRTLAIVRLGRTVERTVVAHRIHRLRDGARYSAALFLVADEVRLRHLRRLTSSLPFPSFLALERHVATASVDTSVWRVSAGGQPVSLKTALALARKTGAWTREPTYRRRSPPHVFTSSGEEADWLLPARLKPAEKRLLDLVSDWPWIVPHHLELLLRVERRRVASLVSKLQRRGLIEASKIDGQRRLVHSDRALTMLAHRDRASSSEARKRWSASLINEDATLEWRNVSGTRTRQLLRHIKHTEAVHSFLAEMASQARSKHLLLRQLDPPHRASRYFRHEGRMHSVQPDAFGLLISGQRRTPLFLEWERRAIRPKTMAARLAPYLRYYSSKRPLEDHGAVPVLLVVLEREVIASRFMMVARDEMDRAGVRLPLFVSDSQRVDQAGPLDAVWLGAEGWSRRRAFSDS